MMASTCNCTTIYIPKDVLNNGTDDLWIDVRFCGNPTVTSQAWFSYNYSVDPSNSSITMVYCLSNSWTPQFKYGISGPYIVPPMGVTVTNGSACSTDSDCFPSPSQTSTPTVTPTMSPTPTITPTLTPTTTITPTVTKTPTVTPTTTITPTVTKTSTPTPSVTKIYCGSGVTQNGFYYTDCCGNFKDGKTAGQQVTLDYTQPYFGITLLNVGATTSCITPSPTRTPTPTPSVTNTPTITITPSITPTITPTNTVTPTPSGIFRLKNDCDVFTLFDMGISCNILKMPSSPTALDGILTINVTGGTSPYSYLWTNNGSINKILPNIGYGSYGVRVIDYYGDYTAGTVCNIVAPTPSVTPTLTKTPTPTPTFAAPNLCLTIQGPTNLGPYQFVPSGFQNGKQKWVNSVNNLTLYWNNSNNLNRWQIDGLSQLTPVSNTTAQIPLSGWIAVSNQGPWNVAVTQGNCPSVLPLISIAQVKDTGCAGGPCTGSIFLTTTGGVPPYQYSIDGVNFQTSNVFNNICQGQYTIITKDNSTLRYSQIVQVNSNANPTAYSVSITPQGTQVVNSSTQIFNWTMTVNPPLPAGVTLTVSVAANVVQQIQGPFYNSSPSETFIISAVNKVFDNGVLISPTSSSPVVQLIDRPNCSPNQIQKTSYTDTINLSISSTDVISGQTTSTITNVGFATSNGCVATGVQSVTITPVFGVIDGCSCCSVNLIQTPQGISNQTVQAVAQEPKMIFQWQINPSANVFVNNPVYVAGLVCTDVYPIGCLQNIRMSEPEIPLTNDNQIRTSYFNIPTLYPNLIKTYVANFSVNANGNQSVKVIIYKDGIELASNTLTQYFETGETYKIPVEFTTAQNFNQANTTYKVLYTTP